MKLHKIQKAISMILASAHGLILVVVPADAAFFEDHSLSRVAYLVAQSRHYRGFTPKSSILEHNCGTLGVCPPGDASIRFRTAGVQIRWKMEPQYGWLI